MEGATAKSMNSKKLQSVCIRDWQKMRKKIILHKRNAELGGGVLITKNSLP